MNPAPSVPLLLSTTASVTFAASWTEHEQGELSKMSTPAIEIDLVVPTPNVAQVRSPKIGLAHFLRTDAGNAELFAHLYGDRVRYDHLQSRWLIWDIDRKRWTVDTARRVRTFAIEAARRRLRAAQELATTDDDENPRHRKEMAWALKSESRLFLDAMLELAKSMPKVSDPGTKWDTDPFVLGVANGLVDLRTGRLRDERPDDRIVKHSSVRFDPHATCPLFEQFLKTIFPANPEMPIYVRAIRSLATSPNIGSSVISDEVRTASQRCWRLSDFSSETTQ
jgi:phage/plasmid-associated DNA primase